ncbi:Argininosuccinate synthase [Habropoda laboriosa]|uniref:Argininosuccinate synthase n=1 Tax=Habropoda laboriosa TaxID=597456 RepID=A0A0L7QPD2_9HYME|nr:PREDICTED: argininosuccinate synthase [Habropoda laboriosa]KOC60492.1 Argininosuccinate synthase [Habropoda laboriosa]
MSETAKKVVLAYSGGLDTSCILLWLKEQGYQVIAYMANIGQNEDFSAAKKKALKTGAVKVVIEDLREVFVSSFVWPLIACGLCYEGRYLLGTAIARPCISEGLIRTAKVENASIIAHGATGKGNDQVRFELSCYSLYPAVQVLAPWREKEFYTRFPGRPDLLKYAQQNGVVVSATPKEPWSTDANLLHISYESGILENPAMSAPKQMYKMTDDPLTSSAKPEEIEIDFKQGYPSTVRNLTTKEVFSTSLEIMQYLNKIGGLHGVGRIDIVENRFIGLKSRGVYESPGSKILYEAHLDLETFILDREVLRVKSYLTNKMSDYVYNGFWFSPECDFVRNGILHSQKYVTGTVKLELYKGNVSILSRYSKASLYNESLTSMDVQGDFEPEDAGGFIRTQAYRLKEFNRFKNECDI